MQILDEDVTVAEALGPNDSDLRCQDTIAQKMWDDYVLICAERGIDDTDGMESELDDDSDLDDGDFDSDGSDANGNESNNED